MPAGELAALLGPAALESDKWNRLRSFRKTAQEALAALPSDQRLLAESSPEGVNAGLVSLTARPPEYLECIYGKWALARRSHGWNVALPGTLHPSPKQRSGPSPRRFPHSRRQTGLASNVT